MNAFTIKDLENLSGIKAHTLRIWEQRYNFIKPSRTDTNIRYYTNEELKTIMNIALLNKSGVKISRISKMSEREISSTILSLGDTEAQQERIINELIAAMIDFQTVLFESSLNKMIATKGLDYVIKSIIFPFLTKVGVLWTTNHINPAQEHLITNIIRQKLIVGIDRVPAVTDTRKQVLLFLPEGEFHELGLLYVYYMLKSQGVSVVYVGANLPLKDLKAVINAVNPDYIYSHLTSLANSFNMEKLLNNLIKYGGGYPFYISGHITLTYTNEIPENVFFIKSLEEVNQLISTTFKAN